MRITQEGYPLPRRASFHLTPSPIREGQSNCFFIYIDARSGDALIDVYRRGPNGTEKAIFYILHRTPNLQVEVPLSPKRKASVTNLRFGNGVGHQALLHECNDGIIHLDALYTRSNRGLLSGIQYIK
jgi:hypothetical protein